MEKAVGDDGASDSRPSMSEWMAAVKESLTGCRLRRYAMSTAIGWISLLGMVRECGRWPDETLG